MPVVCPHRRMYVLPSMECAHCPNTTIDNSEVLCGDGQLLYRDGFWRSNLVYDYADKNVQVFNSSEEKFLDKSTIFYECPCPSCCSVHNTSGQVTCLKHTRGPLCSVCEDGYFSFSSYSTGGMCQKCSSLDRIGLPLVLALVVLVLTMVGYKTMHSCSKNATIRRGHAKGFTKRFNRRLVGKFKILLAFYQVIAFIPRIYVSR